MAGTTKVPMFMEAFTSHEDWVKRHKKECGWYNAYWRKGRWCGWTTEDTIPSRCMFRLCPLVAWGGVLTSDEEE